ncbi:uncharacterized protein LOC107304867 [Oryza brachyantha]|uniref:uncharacterized protein LOC107304867 n=1 Tax=Oryza brachyantha TaxID=4533 RepID=UPI001ADB7DB6|nr:uncharacterized protein LOC107304867 [Oryza brachyantha]
MLQFDNSDNELVWLCALNPTLAPTCSLELELKEDENVHLSVVGQSSIHLSGYYYNKMHQDISEKGKLKTPKIEDVLSGQSNDMDQVNEQKCSKFVESITIDDAKPTQGPQNSMEENVLDGTAATITLVLFYIHDESCACYKDMEYMASFLNRLIYSPFMELLGHGIKPMDKPHTKYNMDE